MLKRYFKNFALVFDSAVENGILLFASSILAILAMNSKSSNAFEFFFNSNFVLSWLDYRLSFSLKEIIDDFLMSVFFLFIGIEMKLEILEGHLSTRKQRLLPLVAAIGGVCVPIIIYAIFNYSNQSTNHGWAIPSATDIAFTLGALSLFKSKIPVSLRVFITALAVIDDMIAVIIIGIFYSSSFEIIYFLSIALCLASLYLFNRLNITTILPYILLGLLMWFFFLKAGIHPAIAGVFLASIIPLRINDKMFSLLLAKNIQPWVSLFILPLFALANSGFKFSNISLTSLSSSLVLGIASALFIGKQLGIFIPIVFMVKTKIASKPENTDWLQLYGASVLCGIGFTMSLFVALLSFNENINLLELAEAKLGIIIGSIVSLIVGTTIIKFTKHQLK